MKRTSARFDVVVIGGGLAGTCAAIAAARHGARTILIQDRPVLGGNSSSEIRVTPHGAARTHPYAAETGIVAEALLAERRRCHVAPMENGWTNSQWDLTLYDLAQRTPLLTLQLNTTLADVLLADGSRGTALDPDDQTVTIANGYRERPAINPSRRIASIEARVAHAETLLEITGRQFIDCTGDGILAHLAGCSWRWGSEGREEFGELHAPAVPDAFAMGSSIQFYCHDAGRPIRFSAPPWAKPYDDASFFWGKGGRDPNNPRGGFWWLEIGVPFDVITDNELIRHELTSHVLGVWDWMKNKDDRMKEACSNYVIDWIGQVPGKRESRRILGRHLIHENELCSDHSFPDEIAYGGWYLDIHAPGGLQAKEAELIVAEGYASAGHKDYVGPYGLPLSILQSRDIDNLGFAGRNISATKSALGSTRVMNTCAVLGQAIGTAAAIACRSSSDLCELSEDAVHTVQQTLLRDGVFLPHVMAADRRDHIRTAAMAAGSEAVLERVEPQRPSSLVPSPAESEQSGDLAQAIPVHGTHLKSLALCLSLNRSEPASVRLRVAHISSIWDYKRDDARVLAEATLKVPPGVSRWIEWPLDLQLPKELHSGGYVRLELQTDDPGKLTWETSSLPAMACPAYVLLPCGDPGKRGERYHRHKGNGSTFAFAVFPPQPVFSVELARSTANRPCRDAGMWRSEPSLPQSLTATWKEPVSLRQIELHFPGDLLTELSVRPPLSVDAEIARDYHLEALVGDEWQYLVGITDNFQHHRLHLLSETVRTTALRLVVTATNGSPSASLAGFRAYSEPGDYPDPWSSP
ncbi:MAG: FAD-dependent oxidoreductase [Verrucomicrobiae bacterium]